MPVTAESILDTYAADIAAVIGKAPAATPGLLAMHLQAAAEELQFNRVAGWEQLDAAAAYLFDVVNAAPEPRPVSLRTAEHFLSESAGLVRAFLNR